MPAHRQGRVAPVPVYVHEARLRKEAPQPGHGQQGAARALHPHAAVEAPAQPLEQVTVLVSQGRPRTRPQDRFQLVVQVFIVRRQVGQHGAQDGRHALRGVARVWVVEGVEDFAGDRVGRQQHPQRRVLAAAQRPHGLAAQPFPEQRQRTEKREHFRQAEHLGMQVQHVRNHGRTTASGG